MALFSVIFAPEKLQFSVAKFSSGKKQSGMCVVFEVKGLQVRKIEVVAKSAKIATMKT